MKERELDDKGERNKTLKKTVYRLCIIHICIKHYIDMRIVRDRKGKRESERAEREIERRRYIYYA